MMWSKLSPARSEAEVSTAASIESHTLVSVPATDTGERLSSHVQRPALGSWVIEPIAICSSGSSTHKTWSTVRAASRAARPSRANSASSRWRW